LLADTAVIKYAETAGRQSLSDEFLVPLEGKNKLSSLKHKLYLLICCLLNDVIRVDQISVKY
jgi:hypothetical protein